jgi:hypothetical protein
MCISPISCDFIVIEKLKFDFADAVYVFVHFLVLGQDPKRSVPFIVVKC